MNWTMKALFALGMAVGAAAAEAQGLDPAQIGKPATDSWPTYSGDYSGRRFSPLTQIDQTNIKNLGLSWVSRLTAGPGATGRQSQSFGPGNPPTIVGGETDDPVPVRSSGRVSGAVLQVNGILYVSVPDNAWAVDARDGTVLWHYFWKTKGGTHIGNRGMGMYGNWLYFETPDDYLVSLDAKTGKERWHKTIADFNEQYFSTVAPIVIGNHLIVGTADDLDAPGFCSPSILKQGRCSGSGIPNRKRWATLDRRRGRTLTPCGTAAGARGFREVTIRSCISTTSERPTQLRLFPA